MAKLLSLGGMDSISDKTTERSLWRVFLLWAPIFALVYVLSFGPAVRYLGVQPAVRSFYSPLLWAYETFPPFQVCLNKYMKLWDKHW